MLMKNSILSILLCLSFSGCAEAEQAALQPQQAETTQNSSLRQEIQASNQNSEQELSCLQQCGQEARGTVYADCLAEGGNKKDCGVNGRQWYRECLETRCGDEAIQFDDCRTDCRINAKKDFAQCLEKTGSKLDCRGNKKEEVQACIAACE